jgi:hypothetical protein
MRRGFPGARIKHNAQKGNTNATWRCSHCDFSAHLKDAADLKIHFGPDTNAMAEKDFLTNG